MGRTLVTTPAITVVTPCHNQAKHLGLAIQSVLSQTCANFEYLLLDDGSTDATWDIMQKFAQRDARIRCIRLAKQKNVGPVLNRSIREAAGKHWVWCPSDDRLLPHMLKTARQFSKKHPGDVGYSEGEIIDASGNRSKGRWSAEIRTPEETARLSWQHSVVGFTGICIPILVFDRVGNFPTHLKYSEDYAWMIRATIHGVKFVRMPGVLYQKRVHPSSTTKRNLPRILAQVPEIQANLKHYRKIMEKAYANR